MKAIYVKLIDIGVFDAHLVEAEKIGLTYKITPLDDSKYLPSRTRVFNLLPYTDVLWNELKGMRFQYDKLWERRVELSKQTLDKLTEEKENE